MIEGAITKEDFESRKDNFKGHKVVAYCTIGYRSGKYVENLKADKFDAWNLKGSILSWTHVGGKLTQEGGGDTKPTDRVHVFGKDWDLASTEYRSVYYKQPVLKVVGDTLGGFVPQALKFWKWGGR